MNAKKIRLLHLIKSLDVGGIEKSTVTYSNLLLDELDFVGILAQPGLFNHENIVDGKIRLFHPPYPVFKWIYFISNFRFIKKIIIENNITHIHYHHRIFLPFIYFIKKSFPEIKIIYSHHSLFNDYLNKFLIADAAITVSDATNNDFVKSKNISVHQIPHGITSIEAIEGSTNMDPKTFGFVGRFHESKGILVLLEAFRMIDNKELKLLLRGTGNYKQEIIQSIYDGNFPDNVIIEEPKTSIVSLYDSIDFLVLPSLELEGFGLVILEAMSLGIPVIVSNLPSFKEIITDQQNGILFIQGDSKDLAKKMTHLLNNPDLQKTIIEGGYMSLRESYKIDETINQYIKVYESV